MAVTASPVDPDVVWVGTEPSEVWRSGDAGSTWEQTSRLETLSSSSECSFPPRPDTHHVRWIACHPLEPERLWVAIEAGALGPRSTAAAHGATAFLVEIWLSLRHRWTDGTTHLRFDPLELLERLAVLTPRPRVNLILYYGVLAPRAAWRAALVPGTSDGVDDSDEEASVEAATRVARRAPGLVRISGPS